MVVVVVVVLVVVEVEVDVDVDVVAGGSVVSLVAGASTTVVTTGSAFDSEPSSEQPTATLPSATNATAGPTRREKRIQFTGTPTSEEPRLFPQ